MLPTSDRAPQPARDNPLTRKLVNFAPLSHADRQVLETLLGSEQSFPADVDIICEGMAPRAVFLLKEGMAARYRNLPDGGRQIITFLIPGDLCDLRAFMLQAMDHSIGTITASRIASIPRSRIMDIVAHHPRISAALWWSSMQEEAMLRERIVSLGRRDARARVAYLLCELLWRYEAVGLANDRSVELPLTQTELGDALGLTAIHVNRVLKRLRSDGLIETRHRTLHMLNVAGLQKIGGFNQDYLHLDGATTELAQYFDALEQEEITRGRDAPG